MDISSKGNYPSNSLSNFAPHQFILDGVVCNSMEGFLQGLKFSNPDMQKYVCTLVGFGAKMKGKNKTWWKDRILYWDGKEINRDEDEYQELLDRAYFALSQNSSFRRAILASGSANLTHAMGKKKKNETILTEQEFCSRLMKVRELIKQGKL